MVPAALVAAVATAGCFPVVSNQQAAQQDVIGGVEVSGDICTNPQALALLVNNGPPVNLRALAQPGGVGKAVARGGLPSELEQLLRCPSPQELEDMLESSDVDFAAVAGIPNQILVAHRVPSGAVAPETFQATGTVKIGPVWQGVVRGGGAVDRQVSITFRRAPEMDAQLEEFYETAYQGLPDAPKIVGAGQKVVGYVSSQLPGPLAGSLRVEAQHGLPAGTVSSPYAGPFNALTMAGSRVAVTEDQFDIVDRAAGLKAARGVSVDPDDLVDLLDPNRPVQCIDDDLQGGIGGGVEAALTLAFCPFPTGFVSGTQEELVEKLTEALQGVDAATRDLRLLGSEGFAEQGGTATVPFTLRTAGAASGAQLGFTAGTALGGASAAPVHGSLAFPATGDHRTGVNVQVPENAAPGTYAVTLTATVAGQTRTGTGRVVVLPKQVQQGSTPPAGGQSQSRGRDNVYLDRDGNIAFGWICPPACGSATADVTAPKAGIAPRATTAQSSKPRLLRIARGKFNAKTGKRARVKIKLYPKARRAVRRGRQVKALIVVRKNGRGTPTVRRVTIKLRKAKR